MVDGVIETPVDRVNAESAANTLRPATMLTKKPKGFKGSINSLQPMPVERLGSAYAVDITAPAWLSFVR